MSVVDASLLIDVVLGLPAGRLWRRWVATSSVLAAPDCVGVEVGRYLRRHVLGGRLPVDEAEDCLRAVQTLGIEVYPTAPLLEEAFALRENFTFDDALYVALARRLDEALATTDNRLERAAERLGVRIAHP